MRSRWVRHAGLWSLGLLGGAGVYVALEGGWKGVLLACGALAMDVSVTMIHADLARARQAQVANRLD